MHVFRIHESLERFDRPIRSRAIASLMARDGLGKPRAMPVDRRDGCEVPVLVLGYLAGCTYFIAPRVAYGFPWCVEIVDCDAGRILGARRKLRSPWIAPWCSTEI